MMENDTPEKAAREGRLYVTPDPAAHLKMAAQVWNSENFNVIAWQLMLGKLVEKGVFERSDAVEMCATLVHHLREGPAVALHPGTVDEVCNFIEDIAGDYLKK